MAAPWDREEVAFLEDTGPRRPQTPQEKLEEAERLFNWSTEDDVIDRAILEMNDAKSLLEPPEN